MYDGMNHVLHDGHACKSTLAFMAPLAPDYYFTTQMLLVMQVHCQFSMRQ